MDPENWMRDLNARLKRISILCLAIPGSHDSLSYSVSNKSSLSPDAPHIAKLLNKICGPLLRKVTFNWCVTQNVDLRQQFKLGIRYFDLRVATKESEIYSCHALYGMNIIKALQIIDDMLLSHPQEIVVLDFQHFYNFSDSSHLFLVDTLYSIFGERLCIPPKDVSLVTLHWLQENGIQVIIIYRSEWASKISYLWSSSKWITLWPNTVDIKVLYNFLTDELKKRPQNTGYVSQCLFTPSPRFIACHILSSLKEKCGITCDMEIKSLWIEKQKSLSWKGVNVIIADFIDVEKFDFCPTVIGINNQSSRFD